MTPRPAPPPVVPWWRTLTREHWVVFSFASLAWVFDCQCQQIFTLGRPGAVDTLLRDPHRVAEYGSYPTSFLLIGWAAGGLVFGALGDRVGRARVLGLTLVIYSLGTALCAFASTFPRFCACLVLAGLGIGGVFGLAVALVADSVPDAARPPALGILQSLSTWGNILAAGIGFALAAAGGAGLLPFHLQVWQALFLVGAVPAFLCCFVLRRLREPPRWLAARSDGRARGVPFGSYRSLLRRQPWARRAWLGLAFCCSGIIGLWGLGNFHPTIVRSIVHAHLAATGLTPQQLAGAESRWSSLGLLLQNLGGFAGMMTMAKLAQTWGRRPALGLSLLLSFAFTVLVFRGLRATGQIYWMLPLMGFGQLGVFGVYAIYLPELFPTSLRSTGTSFCYNFGRLAAATAPFTIGQITRRLGNDIEGFRTAGLWVSLLLLAGLATLPFLPETRGRPLPEELPGESGVAG